MPECVFCDEQVIAESQIYQTKLSRIIIDKKPIAPGHCLIISKRHVPSFSYLSPDEVEEVAYLIKKLGLALMRAVRAEGYNVLFNEGVAAGQTVTHFHIHIIPRQIEERVHVNPKDVLADAMKSRAELSPDKLKEARDRLAKEIY